MNYNCSYCQDTKQIKVPNDQEKFDSIIDREMDGGHPLPAAEAQEKAYRICGYHMIECPYCKNEKEIPEKK
ncbi:MAG: hypothetical protein MJ070_00885 [Lachnospiraceae bacterium]|nr:hypothetical protein [Lachnospiraceae bacterium]